RCWSRASAATRLPSGHTTRRRKRRGYHAVAREGFQTRLAVAARCSRKCRPARFAAIRRQPPRATSRRTGLLVAKLEARRSERRRPQPADQPRRAHPLWARPRALPASSAASLSVRQETLPAKMASSKSLPPARHAPQTDRRRDQVAARPVPPARGARG